MIYFFPSVHESMRWASSLSRACCGRTTAATWRECAGAGRNKVRRVRPCSPSRKREDQLLLAGFSRQVEHEQGQCLFALAPNHRMSHITGLGGRVHDGVDIDEFPGRTAEP